MQLDPTLIGPILIAAGVVVLALIVWAMVRRRHNDAESRHGTIRDHERDDRFEIRPLPLEQKQRFAREWQQVEARFVERPTTAVVEAEELIDEVLRHSGFPVRDHEGTVSDLTTHKPRLVEDYRAGHEIITREDRSGMDTEELRKAMLHYRTLYEDLVGPVRMTERAARIDAEVPIQTVQETEPASTPSDRHRDDRRLSDEQLESRHDPDRIH